jgi:hypothetical protein
MEDPLGSDSGGSHLRIHPLWLVLVGALLWSAPASATKYAGAFMEDGGGARALGMGSAFVAVADDASAAFFNPAGIVDAQRVELMLMHSERFGDLVDRDYFSYVQPLRGPWRGLGRWGIRHQLDPSRRGRHPDHVATLGDAGHGRKRSGGR